MTNPDLSDWTAATNDAFFEWAAQFTGPEDAASDLLNTEAVLEDEQGE